MWRLLRGGGKKPQTPSCLQIGRGGKTGNLEVTDQYKGIVCVRIHARDRAHALGWTKQREIDGNCFKQAVDP